MSQTCLRGQVCLLLCSVGTGSFFRLPKRQELRGYNNLQWAGLAISQLMNDASELNQTILRWLGTSPNARPIDLQIGTLAGDRPGAATLLHYLRYDIPLLRQSLLDVGLEYEEKRVQELWEMSDVRNLADLEKSGPSRQRPPSATTTSPPSSTANQSQRPPSETPRRRQAEFGSDRTGRGPAYTPREKLPKSCRPAVQKEVGMKSLGTSPRRFVVAATASTSG